MDETQGLSLTYDFGLDVINDFLLLWPRSSFGQTVLGFGLFIIALTAADSGMNVFDMPLNFVRMLIPATYLTNNPVSPIGATRQKLYPMVEKEHDLFKIVPLIVLGLLFATHADFRYKFSLTRAKPLAPDNQSSWYNVGIALLVSVVITLIITFYFLLTHPNILPAQGLSLISQYVPDTKPTIRRTKRKRRFGSTTSAASSFTSTYSPTTATETHGVTSEGHKRQRYYKHHRKRPLIGAVKCSHCKVTKRISYVSVASTVVAVLAMSLSAVYHLFIKNCQCNKSADSSVPSWTLPFMFALSCLYVRS